MYYDANACMYHDYNTCMFYDHGNAFTVAKLHACIITIARLRATVERKRCNAAAPDMNCQDPKKCICQLPDLS